MDQFDAKTGMTRFLAAQEQGQKVFEEKLFSTYNLSAHADVVNAASLGFLAPRTFTFFTTAAGNVGQGFGGGGASAIVGVGGGGIGQGMTFAETNLQGAGGQISGGLEFIGKSFGVFVYPGVPIAVKQPFLEHSYIAQKRLSHTWDMGSTQLWPCAEYGLQSLSATTTIANSLVEFSVNGRISAPEFQPGGEIYFPSKQIVQFDLTTTQGFFCTADGLLASADNPIVPVQVMIVIKGWRFELITT